MLGTLSINLSKFSIICFCIWDISPHPWPRYSVKRKIAANLNISVQGLFDLHSCLKITGTLSIENVMAGLFPFWWAMAPFGSYQRLPWLAFVMEEAICGVPQGSTHICLNARVLTNANPPLNNMTQQDSDRTLCCVILCSEPTLNKKPAGGGLMKWTISWIGKNTLQVWAVWAWSQEQVQPKKKLILTWQPKTTEISSLFGNQNQL